MNVSQILQAEGLSRRFGRREVVQDVNLSLAPGEVVGLLGPNGAGKTTIFRMLSGNLRPSRGVVRLKGEDVTGLPLFKRARKGLTYLPQEISIFSRLTVRQNILAILEAVVPSKKERSVRLEVLLEELGLQDKASQRAGSLSGGERRRLEITLALILDPSFMLLDEPLAGVDPITVVDVQEIIRQLKARGIGIMITDHNVRETLLICDRAYILNEGLVLTEGTPEQISGDKRARELYLGENFSLV
ncbi:MAG: LPS export ABC transporter ATP-binding protein [Deltaproteobacteria bacterium]|nr:LPS export ABC transporter ATP-binding protein [Deltaproteobacteria bacterium]